MSAQNTLLTAVKANERGAYEYLPKPFDLSAKLLLTVATTFGNKSRKSGRNSDQPRRERPPAMQSIYQVAD